MGICIKTSCVLGRGIIFRKSSLKGFSHHTTSVPSLQAAGEWSRLPCIGLSISLVVQTAAEQRCSPVLGTPIEMNGEKHGWQPLHPLQLAQTRLGTEVAR